MVKSAHPSGISPELVRILAKHDFLPTVPRDQQIASHMRDLLQKEQIPAHTKLPSVRTLAGLWDTNYHTVYDALKRLSGEGLVVLRPVRGSFVAPPRRALRNVCLYHNIAPHLFEGANDFYVRLGLELNNRLSHRGIVATPYYDRRAHAKLHTMPADLRVLASEGKIDAVIAVSIYPPHASWLYQLEVPVASLMFAQPERRIEVDIPTLARKVIEVALKSGKKTVGLIHHPIGVDAKEYKADFFRMELEKQALAHGISVIFPGPLTEYETMTYMHWEQVGSIRCEKLLAAPVLPEMIFVYPDTFLRGVVLTLVKHHIQVPEKLLLVSHRNAESDIYIPFPMTWIAVKIDDFAAALIDQIDRQIAGEKLTPTTIELKIKETAPYQPPA